MSGGDFSLTEVGDIDNGGDDQSGVASAGFGLFCNKSLILDTLLAFDFEARPSRIFFRRSLNKPITIAPSSGLEATAGLPFVETTGADMLDCSLLLASLGDAEGEWVAAGGEVLAVSITGVLLVSTNCRNSSRSCKQLSS